MRTYLSFLIILCLGQLYTAQAQYYDKPKEHQCLQCHSQHSFSFHNDLMEKDEKRLMNPYYVLDTVAMRTGVHHVFDCTDCHSFEYSTYPHDANLKLQPMNGCLDCHGGDPTYASYQFDRIDEEFKKSIHYQLHGDDFSCSKCHDQHTYRPIARNSSSVKEIVAYSNNMCLNCHNDMSRYQMVAGKEKPELVQVHSWLPNQQLHFQNVRCIECHTHVTDSMMVSHNILPKTEALKSCIGCHSGSSKLKASLYKYENLQKRSSGPLGAFISNESYVIGTHQVPFLQTLSVIILILALCAIAIHTFFRILKSKKNGRK